MVAVCRAAAVYQLRHMAKLPQPRRLCNHCICWAPDSTMAAAGCSSSRSAAPPISCRPTCEIRGWCQASRRGDTETRHVLSPMAAQWHTAQCCSNPTSPNQASHTSACGAAFRPTHQGARQLNIDRKRGEQHHVFDDHHRRHQGAVGALALKLLQHRNLYRACEKDAVVRLGVLQGTRKTKCSKQPRRQRWQAAQHAISVQRRIAQ